MGACSGKRKEMTGVWYLKKLVVLNYNFPQTVMAEQNKYSPKKLKSFCN
jgi:hypothetical protein